MLGPMDTFLLISYLGSPQHLTLLITYLYQRCTISSAPVTLPSRGPPILLSLLRYLLRIPFSMAKYYYLMSSVLNSGQHPGFLQIWFQNITSLISASMTPPISTQKPVPSRKVASWDLVSMIFFLSTFICLYNSDVSFKTQVQPVSSPVRVFS